MLFGTSQKPYGMKSGAATLTAIRAYEEQVTGDVPESDASGGTDLYGSAKKALRNLVASNNGDYQERESDDGD
jgi:hypothetical protein